MIGILAFVGLGFLGLIGFFLLWAACAIASQSDKRARLQQQYMDELEDVLRAGTPDNLLVRGLDVEAESMAEDEWEQG